MIAQERAAERQQMHDENMNKDTVQQGRKIKTALEEVGRGIAEYAELVGGKHEALREKDNALARKVDGVEEHPDPLPGGKAHLRPGNLDGDPPLTMEEETGDARMGLEESPPAADAQARKSAL